MNTTEIAEFYCVEDEVFSRKENDIVADCLGSDIHAQKLTRMLNSHAALVAALEAAKLALEASYDVLRLARRW